MKRGQKCGQAKRKTLENAVFSRVSDGDSSGIRTPDTLIKSQGESIANTVIQVYHMMCVMSIASRNICMSGCVYLFAVIA